MDHYDRLAAAPGGGGAADAGAGGRLRQSGRLGDTAGPARFATFDRLIAGPGAALADGFEVQSQQTEATPSATTFVAQAIATARAVHPGAPVLAGLSTNPNGRRVTAADLLAVYRAARSAGATGFWLNIPQTSAECPRCGTPQTPIAVAFLRALGPAATGVSSP